MTALLQPVAPTVLLLEGGYNLAATSASVEACVRVLLGEPPARLAGPLIPTRVGLAGIQAALAVQARCAGARARERDSLCCCWSIAATDACADARQ
jgi:hypothetical protein